MTSPVDLDNLHMLRELLAERFEELINTYLKDSAQRIDKLREALASDDMHTVTHQAHGLKGSSRNLGANPLADLCAVMETQSRDGCLEAGQQQLAAIEQSFAAVAEELRALL